MVKDERTTEQKERLKQGGNTNITTLLRHTLAHNS